MCMIYNKDHLFKIILKKVYHCLLKKHHLKIIKFEWFKSELNDITLPIY